jgi:hypothetical protein
MRTAVYTRPRTTLPGACRWGLPVPSKNRPPQGAACETEGRLLPIPYMGWVSAAKIFMIDHSIEVVTSTLGRRATPEDNHLVVRLLEEHLSAAELIRRTVEERIRESAARQWVMRAPAGQQTLARSEGSPAAEMGSVLFAPRQLRAPVPEVEIEKALRGFESGHYLLLVNDRRVTSLDEELFLPPSAKAQFWRLTPLVGG